MSLGLPAHYRLLVRNVDLGVTLAVNAVQITVKRQKYDNQGALVIEATPATIYDNGTTIANGAELAGGTIDNTSDGYLSAYFLASVTTPATPNGNIAFVLQWSNDGGVTWATPSGNARLLRTVRITAAGTEQIQLSFP